MTKPSARKEIMRIVNKELPKITITKMRRKDGLVEFVKATKKDEALSRKWSMRISELMGVLER